MKKLLLDIVYNLTYLVLYMVAYPVTLTGFIVGSIKHESKEQCCRRAFRLMPRFLRTRLTEDEFIDCCRSKNIDI